MAARRVPHPWDSPGKNTGVGCHFPLQCMKVKSESEVTQSYPTLSNPMDCSLPGSSIHGILQVRILEWVAISFSNAWKWKVKVKSLSHVRLLATPWTVAYQAPPSMGFSRQEHWSWGATAFSDGPRDCHMEWSKSEKEIWYVNTYMWNLEN